MSTLQFETVRLEALAKDDDEEKRRKYQGIVRVAIDHLVFAPDNTSCDHNVNSAKVTRLKRIFKTEGCKRHCPQNFITGEIPHTLLQEALRLSRLTAEELQEGTGSPVLYLPPGSYIRCANGRSRTKALRDSNGTGLWWTIELYSELNSKTFEIITESYLNEGSFSDGDICAKIVHYRSHDLAQERKWWARLSKSKAGILRRVLKHTSLASPLLELILHMPGMREGMEIGTWHKITAGKCDEEIIRYLEFIRETWIKIMGSREALQYVDAEDVREFQLRVPGVSQRDYSHLVSLILNETAFKRLTDGLERRKLIDRMNDIKHLIPSIYTLQKDFKYLRACTDTLKLLVHGTSKLPFTAQTLAYDAFTSKSRMGPDSLFLEKLKRLYLRIMRDIVELTGQSPLLEDGEPPPENYRRQQRSWYRLANHARSLGFDSEEIARLASENPDHKVALRALHDARPPSEYEYDKSTLQSLIDSIAQNFCQAKERDIEDRDMSFTTTGVGEPLTRRCGRQYSQAYAADRWFFKLSDFSRPIQKSTDVTSLFVRRSVFHAFWGIEENDDESMSVPSPPIAFPPTSPPAPPEDELMIDQPLIDLAPQHVGDHPMETHQIPERQESWQDDMSVVLGIQDMIAFGDRADVQFLWFNTTGWKEVGKCRRQSIQTKLQEIIETHSIQDPIFREKDGGRTLLMQDLKSHPQNVFCITSRHDNIPQTFFPAQEEEEL